MVPITEDPCSLFSFFDLGPGPKNHKFRFLSIDNFVC